MGQDGFVDPHPHRVCQGRAEIDHQQERANHLAVLVAELETRRIARAAQMKGVDGFDVHLLRRQVVYGPAGIVICISHFVTSLLC